MKSDSQVMVKKFGGTSVGSPERILAVAKRVTQDAKFQKPIVVVSAMSGETNRLVALAEGVFPGFRGPAYDMVLASGEQVSTALMAMALEAQGIKAKPYLAHQLGIRTDTAHSKARIQSINIEPLMRDIDAGCVPVIAGFQGVDEFDNITTLGRGGSDTTAVALAVAMKLPSCEIYTDVPAVFTADPRLVPNAREIGKISFEEMLEMASLGSKILHIRSVELAAKFGVRLHVRTTFEKREGTWVVPEGEIVEEAVVSSVTHEQSTAIFKIYPIKEGSESLANLFEALSKMNIVVDIITQSQGGRGQRIAFSLPKEDVNNAKSYLVKSYPDAKIEVMENVSKVSVVGVGMRNHPGVAAKFFRTLSDLHVHVHLVTTSEIKVSAVIDSKHLEKSAQGLHKIFELEKLMV